MPGRRQQPVPRQRPAAGRGEVAGDSLARWGRQERCRRAVPTHPAPPPHVELVHARAKVPVQTLQTALRQLRGRRRGDG
jgi:hypothetical protein